MFIQRKANSTEEIEEIRKFYLLSLIYCVLKASDHLKCMNNTITEFCSGPNTVAQRFYSCYSFPHTTIGGTPCSKARYYKVLEKNNEFLSWISELFQKNDLACVEQIPALFSKMFYIFTLCDLLTFSEDGIKGHPEILKLREMLSQVVMKDHNSYECCPKPKTEFRFVNSMDIDNIDSGDKFSNIPLPFLSSNSTTTENEKAGNSNSALSSLSNENNGSGSSVGFNMSNSEDGNIVDVNMKVEDEDDRISFNNCLAQEGDISSLLHECHLEPFVHANQIQKPDDFTEQVYS
jgi:hypothetical protein